MTENYDIPKENSLDSMEGIDDLNSSQNESTHAFSDETVEKIKSFIEYVGENDDSVENEKKQAYALWQIGYFLKKDGNIELYIKSILSSLGTGIKIIQKSESVEEVTEVIGHFIIKSIKNALELEELRSKEYIIRIAELTASVYEGWGGNRQAQRLYECIDPVKYQEKISQLSLLPDWSKEGQNIGGEIFIYKDLDIKLVKDYLNSLSLGEIMLIDQGELLKQLEKLVNK